VWMTCECGEASRGGSATRSTPYMAGDGAGGLAEHRLQGYAPVRLIPARLEAGCVNARETT
jgi:hypothetical protein